MTTPTLTEFLLARIAEDEDLARWAGGDETTPSPSREWTWDPDVSEVTWWPPDDPDHADIRKLLEVTEYDRPHGPEFTAAEQYAGGHIARHDPARILAECDAKRRIIQTVRLMDRQFVPEADDIIYALALPYTDHPDYREEWKG